MTVQLCEYTKIHWTIHLNVYNLWSEVLVTQWYSTLCDPMGYSRPSSSVYEILQARILEWVAISFSRGDQDQRPGIELRSPVLQADSLPSVLPVKPTYKLYT